MHLLHANRAESPHHTRCSHGIQNRSCFCACLLHPQITWTFVRVSVDVLCEHVPQPGGRIRGDSRDELWSTCVEGGSDRRTAQHNCTQSPLWKYKCTSRIYMLPLKVALKDANNHLQHAPLGAGKHQGRCTYMSRRVEGMFGDHWEELMGVLGLMENHDVNTKPTTF